MIHIFKKFFLFLHSLIVLGILIYTLIDRRISNKQHQEFSCNGTEVRLEKSKVVERRLNSTNLTFEAYENYRILYEDFLEHERSQDLPNFELRDLHVKTIDKLYTIYKGNPFKRKWNLTPRQKYVMKQKEMICDALTGFKVLIYKQGDAQFKKIKKDHLFPSEPFLRNKRFKTCAIISNSGSIIGSKQGEFIDTHDLVVRLNHATTEGFEVDVGSKTNLRIINSMLIKKKIYNFFSNSNKLYNSNQTDLLTYERSYMNQKFNSWIRTQKLFVDGYFKKRQATRDQMFHMINYESPWIMWKWLNSFVKYPVINYMPSSGFIATQLLMRHCDTLRLFEFIPSKRVTNLCHYFERIRKRNCAFGGDHSLSAEKLSYYIMGNRNREEIFDKGYVTIDTRHCQNRK